MKKALYCLLRSSKYWSIGPVIGAFVKVKPLSNWLLPLANQRGVQEREPISNRYSVSSL